MDPHGDLFEIKALVSVKDFEFFTFTSNIYHQTVVFVLSNSDIVLWKLSNCEMQKSKPVLRWIPWMKTKQKKVQAIAFKPVTLNIDNGVQLLILTLDHTIYILPTQKIINGERVSEIDIIEYRLSISDFVPSTVVWWTCSDSQHRDIAVIGGTGGKLLFYSLSNGICITTLNTVDKRDIISIDVWSNPDDNRSYLLVTDNQLHQSKCLLEKIVFGKSMQSLPLIREKKSILSKAAQSRLRAIRNVVTAEKFSLIRQKLKTTGFESITPAIENTVRNETEVDSSLSRQWDYFDGSAIVSVQQYRRKYILTAFSASDSSFSLFLQENQETRIVTHKLSPGLIVTHILLTDTFIFVAEITKLDRHSLTIFSTRLTKCDRPDNTDFTEDGFIQQIDFDDDEKILRLYKMKGKSLLTEKVESAVTKGMSALQSISKNRFTNKWMSSEDEWRTECLVITNKRFYQIRLRLNPWECAVNGFLRIGGAYVAKHSLIFDLNMSVLMEVIVNDLIDQGKYKTASALYCYPDRTCIKGLVKLASLGRTDEALEHGEEILGKRDLILPASHCTNISNIVAMCYMIKILSDTQNGETVTTRKFVRFLHTNYNYDMDIILSLMNSSRLFQFLLMLAKFKGPYVNIVNLISETLNEEDELNSLSDDENFWELISEKCLINGMLIQLDKVAHVLQYVSRYISTLPLCLLKKFWNFYNPTSFLLKPAVYRVFKESADLINQQTVNATFMSNGTSIVLWITNFLLIHICLCKNIIFNESLIEYVYNRTEIKSKKYIKESTVLMSSFYSPPPILSCGFAHTGNVRNSELFMWGQTNNGCLGIGPVIASRGVPKPVTLFSLLQIAVTHVSCGKEHTLALTTRGVYSWGSSKYGQLGVGRVDECVYPQLIESLVSHSVVYISAGQYHSLAVDYEGRLWSWGWGVHGQLGHGNIDDQFYPKIIETLKSVVIVAACAGQTHSLVLTDTGKIWTFGNGIFGQLGIGYNKKSTRPVELFTITEQITKISTGYFHSLALSVSNKLYSWGINPQILGAQEHTRRKKTRLHKMNETSSLLSSDKLVYSQQSERYEKMNDVKIDKTSATSDVNELTEVSVSDEIAKPYLTPLLVDTTRLDSCIMQISCGGFHNAVLTASGNVYTWGRNLDGQLGTGNKRDANVPTMVNVEPIRPNIISSTDGKICRRPIVQVGCGKDFTTILTDNGQVFSWGSNNNGQLGLLSYEEPSMEPVCGQTEKTNFNILEDKLRSIVRSSKRSIKLPEILTYTIENPQEVQMLSKCRHTVVITPFNLVEETRLVHTIPLVLPPKGMKRVEHEIIDFSELSETNILSDLELLHYGLECFKGFYLDDAIKDMCIKLKNYQGAAKICLLNYNFYGAFNYTMKAYLFPYFSYPLQREQIDSDDVKCLDQALYIFKYYLLSAVNLDGSIACTKHFLHQSLSLWIELQLNIDIIEDTLIELFDKVAYPLSVLLFCNGEANSLCTSLDGDKSSSNIDDPDCVSINANNKDLLQMYDALNEIQLYTSEAILQRLSSEFKMKLCTSIADYISVAHAEEYAEFVGLLNRAIFAPSIIKSDNRTVDQVFSIILNILRQDEVSKESAVCPQQHFIQISYKELQQQNVTQRSTLIVFSCGHNYSSTRKLEQDVELLLAYFHGSELIATKRVIEDVFRSGECEQKKLYPSCCPKCLLLYLTFLIKSSKK